MMQRQSQLMNKMPGMQGFGMPFGGRGMHRGFNQRQNQMMNFPGQMGFNMGGMMGFPGSNNMNMGMNMGMPNMGMQNMGMPNIPRNSPMESMNPAAYMQNLSQMNSQTPNYPVNTGLQSPLLPQSGANSVNMEVSSNNESAVEEQVQPQTFQPNNINHWATLKESEDQNLQVKLILDHKEVFKNLDNSFKLQMLGDLVYKAMQGKNLEDSIIKKITSMIVDFDVLELDEILELLIDENTLNERITEAIDLIENGNDEDDDDEEDEDEENDSN